jgi:shikimate kinase
MNCFNDSNKNLVSINQGDSNKKFQKNLFLVGYRGTGKTVLGKMVAKKIGLSFVDTDELIVKLAGKKIPEIFAEDGEEEFRRIETEALKIASNELGKVISCGGGIVTKERNHLLLKQGIVCLLKADAKTIYERIYSDSNRPSLTNKNPFDEIVHLLDVREPLYQKVKDFEVNTTQSKESCVKQIIQNYLSFL